MVVSIDAERPLGLERDGRARPAPFKMRHGRARRIPGKATLDSAGHALDQGSMSLDGRRPRLPLLVPCWSLNDQR
jgi:hypothetical protein